MVTGKSKCNLRDGRRRTRVFYCDPQRSNQKGSIEVTHEFIRRILPKGTSFDGLTQNDVSLMMSHIDSYKRKKRVVYQKSRTYNQINVLTLNIQ